MRPYTMIALALCAALLATGAGAQTASLDRVRVPVAVSSGELRNATHVRGPIFRQEVRVPGAAWIRLTFDDVVLGGAPAGGQETVIRITSLADGAAQTLDAVTLVQWRHTSAYFNGEAVSVELIADAATGPSRLAIPSVMAGLPADGGIASICGENDDRVPSADPATGRALPTGCTAWLFMDDGGCMLTAGHCVLNGLDVIQFNVPLSDANGVMLHPGPEDQYAVDVASIQFACGQTGSDWSYFGCFPNSETGLVPLVAQGALYEIAETPPVVAGQSIRITGYGLDDTPLEWNRTQQTHSGPYVNVAGTIVEYQVDTRPGNSGSAVIDEQTDQAIGIHTDSGCDAAGGGNAGTAIDNPGLQGALAVPTGVCLPAPLLGFSFPNGLPDMLDPAGLTIRFEVTGLNGGTPQPGTGEMLFDDGSGPVAAAVQEIAANVYDAVLPPLGCGVTVQYHFSAETTTAEVVTNPIFAPLVQYSGLSALAEEVTFADDFELDLGWTVADSPDLTHGTWNRGVPVVNGIHGSPLADADGSGQCFLTDNDNGNSDVDGTSTTLTSPIMDASGDTEIISYWRWYSNGLGSAPFEDVFIVEVSENGGQTWVELETVGPTGPEVNGGWIFRQFSIGDFIVRTDQFRIRFVAFDTGDNSNVEAAVDGIELTSVNCTVPVPGDLDGDGIVGITDFLMLLAEWGACPVPCPPACAADLDGDCAVGITDFLALLGNWG